MILIDNPYVYYIKQLKPDWADLLKDKDGLLYSLIVLNNATGIEGCDIESFDYDQLLSTFQKPLELRKSNFRRHPHFGFLFVETRADNLQEIETILKADLSEFIRPRYEAL